MYLIFHYSFFDMQYNLFANNGGTNKSMAADAISGTGKEIIMKRGSCFIIKGMIERFKFC